MLNPSKLIILIISFLLDCKLSKNLIKSGFFSNFVLRSINFIIFNKIILQF